jgi:hypothetical protein
VYSNSIQKIVEKRIVPTISRLHQDSSLRNLLRFPILTSLSKTSKEPAGEETDKFLSLKFISEKTVLFDFSDLSAFEEFVNNFQTK